MKQVYLIVVILILLCFETLYAQKNMRITSPNDAIHFDLRLVDYEIQYMVSLKGQSVIEYSSLNLKFENGLFENGITLGKPIFTEGVESYDLVVGKAKHVEEAYRQMVVSVQEKEIPRRKYELVIRLFDDGLAFRYNFPKQAAWTSMVLLDEKSTFQIVGNPKMFALGLPHYTSSHEGVYTVKPYTEIPADSLYDMPALLDFDNQYFLGITEAALLDYAGMYLSKNKNVLISKLSPLPGQNGVKVRAALPHKSPWRVFLLSDRLGDLIESNIITNLNEPNKIGDTSWLKPGKTTFPWWNGNIVPNTLNAPGNNFETAQYYIDFCARNGIEYHSVVEYGVHQWYVDDGIRYMPGPNADVTTPVPGLDMQRIGDYGKEKGVGIRVWVHWAALYPKIDTAFALFEKWGISGMMIDFMDRDDQEMVNIQTEMLEKAAKHHLHIQFHGAYKPTGLNRTYPNEFTREGTRNYEVNKWEPKGLAPFDDINIPFTRMLAGATDYHMGGFRAVPQDKYVMQYIEPLMLGTRCHQLAMYVVLESYLQIISDYPKAYEGQPGFDFLKQVPTNWDETKVLNAEAGAYITIARKKNDIWYIGSITNDQSREYKLPLTFLGEGNYQAEIYADATDTDSKPNNLVLKKMQVTNQSVLDVRLAAGGGLAIRIVRENN